MSRFRHIFNAKAPLLRGSSGLFQIKNLRTPPDLTQFASKSLFSAQNLAHQLTSPNLTSNSKLTIQKLDELSNTLCKVVDLASFLRIAHPDPQMGLAAQQSHELLFEFMNMLNTNKSIYKLVQNALKDQNLGYEELKVAQQLNNDFIKSGMHLATTDEKQQQQFINLMNEISIESQEFINDNNRGDKLQSVLMNRLKLAQMAGFENYASYELNDKMMNQKSVSEFLSSISEVRDLAIQDASKQFTDIKLPTFKATKVFDAVADLASKIWGVTITEGSVYEDEIWHPQVKRLDAFDSHTNELLGHIYLDLIDRPGKHKHPSHYTISCSRLASNQLPIVALVCGFTLNNDNDAYLTFYEVETVFHEMGHALHSMVGQTQLHSVSGTRCATDFVEFPSILFETFAQHPYTLGILDPTLDAQSFISQLKLVSVKHWEVWCQLQLSALDQALHGPQFQSTPNLELVSQLINERYQLVPKMQIGYKYNHLITYGATYYSYLFDRCLASLVYQRFTDSSNWELEGAKLRNTVLKFGGAKDPNTMLAEYLNQPLDYSKLAQSLTEQ